MALGPFGGREGAPARRGCSRVSGHEISGSSLAPDTKPHGLSVVAVRQHIGVAISIDTTHALRTHTELTALAEAVFSAPSSEPETDALEWKSAWDLTTTEVRFQTARHLLGFGNRSVVTAHREFEGCAYLLAGVEPSNVVGVKVLDPADIDNALSRFVAPGQPRWSPAYVTLQGRSILIITVESPRPGDAIFTLQRGFGAALPGRIYVRRHGKTEEANPAEVRALEARGAAIRPKVELDVVRTGPDRSLLAVQYSAADRDLWVARQVEQLLAPLEPKPKPPRRPGSFMAPGFNPAAFEMPAISLPTDRRSKDEFRAEVAEYKAAAPRRWTAVVVAGGIKRRIAEVRLEVVNPTEQNFEGVEVLVDLPDGVQAWLDEDEPFDYFDAPEPVGPWGSRDWIVPASIGARLSRGIRLPGPTDEVERGADRWRVRFHPRHVRPGESVSLPAVHLSLAEDRAGGEIDIRWRLTSTGADGWRQGSITYSVAEQLAVVTVPDGG